MASNSARSNLALLRSRARDMRYPPASSMRNTLTDPAKLLLIIPAGTTLAARTILRPVLFDPATPPTAPALLELAPAQTPEGLLCQKGNANATPAWIDGFACVPVNTASENIEAGVINADYIGQLVALAFNFGRIVWKGDEQIMRTVSLGDMQRREIADAISPSNAAAGPTGGMAGAFQAACGAPGRPVYITPGYVWTGRASCDFYIETLVPIANTGAGNTNDLAFMIYVYGQWILNIDPLQNDTQAVVLGGTAGPQAGTCDDAGVSALEQSHARAAAPQIAAAQTVQANAMTTAARTRTVGGR